MHPGVEDLQVLNKFRGSAINAFALENKIGAWDLKKLTGCIFSVLEISLEIRTFSLAVDYKSTFKRYWKTKRALKIPTFILERVNEE